VILVGGTITVVGCRTVRTLNATDPFRSCFTAVAEPNSGMDFSHAGRVTAVRGRSRSAFVRAFITIALGWASDPASLTPITRVRFSLGSPVKIAASSSKRPPGRGVLPKVGRTPVCRTRQRLAFPAPRGVESSCSPFPSRGASERLEAPLGSAEANGGAGARPLRVVPCLPGSNPEPPALPTGCAREPSGRPAS
jgi:hypothetical protein